MRYYAIKITNPSGTLVQTPSSVPGSGYTYTSYANNRSIPGALQVELDIPLKAYATPMGGAMVRIWGITLKEISAATQFNSKNGDPNTAFKIAIYAGMQKGLPLANPAQAGLLVEGLIYQAFGNWVGTDMTLDFILAPDSGTNTTPKNIVLDWKAGVPLATALANTLSTAFPKIKQDINISPKLVLNHDEPGFYGTLEQFATYVKQVSAAIIGGDYPGVDIFLSNNKFTVSDQSTPSNYKSIAFQDLIGQPTWIEGSVIQFKCVMRSDINLMDYVKLPPAIVTNTGATPSSLVNLKSAFEGTFFINEMRHVGNFRNPDAASWVSTFNGAPDISKLQPAS